jgi:hypothetical protein
VEAAEVVWHVEQEHDWREVGQLCEQRVVFVAPHRESQTACATRQRLGGAAAKPTYGKLKINKNTHTLMEIGSSLHVY